MKEWWPLRELLGVAGWPSTKQGFIERALRLGLKSERRSAQGGQAIHYHLSSLPEGLVEALRNKHQAELLSESECFKFGENRAAKVHLKQELDERAAGARRLESLRESTALPDGAQQRIDAKLELLRLVEYYARAHNLPISKAEHQFAEAYNAGRLSVEEHVRRTVPAVSAPSLQRWRLTVKQQGIAALGGDYGKRKGTSKIDRQGALREVVIGMLVRTPHARATHIREALAARFTETPDVELPGLRSIERWMTAWKKTHAEAFTAISNPDQWKSRYMVAFGSASEDIVRLNQRWESDTTPADVMLADGRHSIIGVIDVYSRRFKLHVTKTSKATAIAAVTRRALLDWGVPEAMKTDNGADYTSHHTTRVFRSLDIEHVLCPPFQPWHKPHIERAFGTFTRDLVELLSNFIGHDVTERQAIRDRQSFADRLMTRGAVVEISMSAADFQQFCDKWCEDIYMHRPHEGLDGRTPFERVSAWVEPLRRIEDERALDILLAEAPGNNGIRTVQKKGIQLDDALFIAPELEGWVGRQVQVRYDERDLGRIYVFGGDDMGFICVAECPERTGMDRKEVAAKARELQKRRVQEERAALRAVAKKAKTEDVVNEILREKAEKAGKLRMFPKQGQTHDSAGLRAAADAVAAVTREQRTTADLMSEEEAQRRRAELEAKGITGGIDNTLGRKRLERAKATPHATGKPDFETVFERLHWILKESLFRALTLEEQQYIAWARDDRKERKTFQSALQMVEAQFDRKVEAATEGQK